MSKRSVNRIRKAIAVREKAQIRITKITTFYQPKLDRITRTRDSRTARWRTAVTTADTTIRTELYHLNGRELSTLRRQFPDVPELGGRPLKKEIA
jgi:hypothetical protein